MAGLKQIARLIKQSTVEKEIEDQFIDDLSETISRLDSKDGRKPSQTYKPSSLGGCKRNMYFQVVGADADKNEPSQAGFVGICESGSNRHEDLQTWISRMNEAGFDCEWVDVAEFIEMRKPAGTIVKSKIGMETKCYNEILNISFLCDGVVRYRGKYYIVEIKTEDHFKFSQRVSIVDKHIVQGTAYSTCLGIDDIIFIYENRNYCTKKPFMLHVTPEMKQLHVLDEINEVEEYRQKSTVPPKSTNSKDCYYCNYKQSCRMY